MSLYWRDQANRRLAERRELEKRERGETMSGWNKTKRAYDLTATESMRWSGKGLSVARQRLRDAGIEVLPGGPNHICVRCDDAIRIFEVVAGRKSNYPQIGRMKNEQRPW